MVCVEGMFDTIKLTQKCILNSVALGGLNISDTQINLLKKYTNTFYIVVEDGAMLREDSKNKSVYCIDENGEMIKEFERVKDAAQWWYDQGYIVKDATQLSDRIKQSYKEDKYIRGIKGIYRV